jgi:hypothetical protein
MENVMPRLNFSYITDHYNTPSSSMDARFLRTMFRKYSFQLFYVHKGAGNKSRYANWLWAG